MSSFLNQKFAWTPFLSITIMSCFFIGGAYSQVATPTLAQFTAHDALEGTTTELECNVTNKGDLHLFWFFLPNTGGDGYLIGHGQYAAQYYRPRFSIVVDVENNHYNLKITGVSLSDAGLYTCTLAESGLPSSAGRLTVLQPTPPASGPVCELTTLALKEGEYINGSCSASSGGITPSTLQWIDGRDISVTVRQEDESKLLRHAAARDDGVRYICRETHRALEKPRDCITGVLEVLHKPRVMFYPVDKTAVLGSNATLTCRTTSNPKVQEARLFVNDSQLLLNESSSVDSKFSFTAKTTENGKDLVFTIHGLQDADYFLTILCQAWNAEGERNQTTSFRVPVPSIIDSNLKLILAVDLAALAGVIFIVVIILIAKPACSNLCNFCKNKFRRQDR